MNEFNSKYFKTALRMDEVLIALLEKKDLEYITVKEICEEADVNRSHSTCITRRSGILWTRRRR